MLSDAKQAPPVKPGAQAKAAGALGKVMTPEGTRPQAVLRDDWLTVLIFCVYFCMFLPPGILKRDLLCTSGPLVYLGLP